MKYASFKKVEKHLIETFPILKLENFENTNQSWEEFVENFILNYTYKFVTIKQIDENTWETDTDIEKHRSLGDIFIISRFYYPFLSLKELVSFLFKKTNENIFYCLFCENINKLTFFKAGSRGYGNNFQYMIAQMTYSSHKRISKDIDISFQTLYKLHLKHNNEK